MAKILRKKDENFSEWYTDLVTQAKLISYGPVKGTMILKPDGYAIWQEIQKIMDKLLYDYGVSNVYMPLLMPLSLIEKEKEHINGFAPEFLLITHAGQKKLNDPLVIRPTSEVIFCTYFANEVKSYRDLPLLYNQWANVVRWEKNTRPFLRTSEFLWQEGHTVHNSSLEAEKVTKDLIILYEKFVKEHLALPVIMGQKSELEKFAGAQKTYTIESLMPDGQSLQAATSHYFGQNFSKQFDIKFLNEKNIQEYAYQTSWGISTRIIGAILMVHSDNKGLILPPKLASYQVIIIPIEKDNKKIIEFSEKIQQQLKKEYRVKIDFSNNSYGYKMNDAELKGVPIVMTIGMQETEEQQLSISLRTDELGVPKRKIKFESVVQETAKFLEEIHQLMYKKAEQFLESNIHSVESFEQYEQLLKIKKGYFLLSFCNQIECEKEIKKMTQTVSRCKKDNNNGKPCFKCKKNSDGIYYFARAY